MRTPECYRVLAALVTFGALQIAAGATPATQTQPAQWRPNDLIVELHDLPKVYSCDELWYKFHGVLLQIGARPRMNILAYDCGSEAGAAAYSPRVHLQFQTLEAIPANDARWADTQAAYRTVRLGPGSPTTLNDSDCELLSQIKDLLLPALSDDHTIAFHLACQSVSARHAAFALTVSVLESSDPSRGAPLSGNVS